MTVQRLCVFCGSSPGARPEYRQAAADLAQHLVTKGIGIVYGGSHAGLMGVLADTAMGAGGEVIGVIPEALVAKEVAHRGLKDLRIVGSMHERKAMMADLADAFIAMPGGLGTLEEFCEVLTWTQLGLQRKPCGLLNTNRYFDPLLSMFDHAVGEGFLKPEHRRAVVVSNDPVHLLENLLALELPHTTKWPAPDPGNR